jgi:hypothetical protein
MSDSGSGSAWPPSENDEYEPALPLPANRFSRPRRAFVASVILIIVFGIVASLTVIGVSRLERTEPRPPLQEEASTPPKQPDERPSVEPIEPLVEPHESLVLGAARSYLALANANAQTETEIYRLRACLSIEDGYKERLDCYDTVVPPNPKPKPPVAKLAADCKFLKEEDERLACFNRVLTQLEPPKAVQKANPKTQPSK